MHSTMTKLSWIFFLSLLVTRAATGQPSTAYSRDLVRPSMVNPEGRDSRLDYANLVPPPSMSPELTMRTYQERTALQDERLESFSAATVILADLPSLAQQGEYKVHKRYTAPSNLEFDSGYYVGDGFVKTNVIIRLLQSEVDRVRRRENALTAVVASNYKFSHVGTVLINGRSVHSYKVTPRLKRPGLFKGRIYLDPSTGALVRTEGTLVKTPSFFIKRIVFAQDYAQFGDFTFPVHVHVVAFTRLVGRAVVEIYHRDYQTTSANPGHREANRGAEGTENVLHFDSQSLRPTIE